ncbi:MAG TPA: ABC transporter permease subunit [Bacilli bacterium]|nr:ABC transporter permease subunit [Bacilli bacterium]
MWTIAKLSCREVLSKRIFLITILMTLAFLLFYGVATHYGSREFAEELQQRGGSGGVQMERAFVSTQLLGVGLYFASFITALLSILACVGAVSGEIESHQIDTILARPLRRRDVIFGKYLGFGGLLVIYALGLFAGILLINQTLGGVLQLSLHLSQIVGAAALFAMQPLVLVAAALWLSSRMTTINGGVILIILYGIGFIGGFVEQLGVLLNNNALVNSGIVTSLIFPLDSLFRKMTLTLFDAPSDPFSFAAQGLFGSLSAPSGLMIGYALLYGAVMLLLAFRQFAKRDL